MQESRQGRWWLEPGCSLGDGENWPDLKFCIQICILGIELANVVYGRYRGRVIEESKLSPMLLNLINWEDSSAV